MQDLPLRSVIRWYSGSAEINHDLFFPVPVKHKKRFLQMIKDSVNQDQYLLGMIKFLEYKYEYIKKDINDNIDLYSKSALNKLANQAKRCRQNIEWLEVFK